MEILNKFYNLTNIIKRLSDISFNSINDLSNSLSNLTIQNNLKIENNCNDFIINFDYINNILFLEKDLENIYKNFFQNHLHLISNEYEDSEYNNHLSVLITYYNLLMGLLNERNLDIYINNLSLDTMNEILHYLEVLNEYVFFDTQNETYNDLDETRKIIICKIEYLVLLIIEKIKEKKNYDLKDYQEMTRIYFNTIQLIVYILIHDY